VCQADLAASQAVLIENLEPDYLLFERAARLRRAGLAPRVIVPVWVDMGTATPNDVFLGIADVMAKISGLGAYEVVPVRQAEPITLTAARDVDAFLRREQIRSITLVTPLFRSRRSALVAAATLERSGIEVRCQPVEGTRSVETWTASWHGIQMVGEQWLKLQYYRFYVLPRLRVYPQVGAWGGWEHASSIRRGEATAWGARRANTLDRARG
jgi:hypothetical protein